MFARHRWIGAAIASLTLGLAVIAAYAPGLAGPFVFDDAENITANPPVALSVINATTLADALLANDAGPLKRPLASLTFALNHFFAGSFESALAFKVTNVAIHIINSWLVYALILALTGARGLATQWDKRGRARFAFLCAAVWALHPIQLTSVLYVVQRMTSLAGTFVLAGLWIYVRGRLELANNPARAVRLMAAGLVGGMLLGITAKETAVLLPVYALAVEFSVFSRTELLAAARRRLVLIYGIALAVPVAILAAYALLHPGFMAESYAARTFTPVERILTEARVLWRYLGMLVYPVPSQFGLFHDDIAPSTGLFSPPTTLPALLGLIAAAIWALAGSLRHPLTSLGILWFLAGHSLESTIIGLELAHEHRNYLPSLGPIIAAAGALRFSRAAPRVGYATQRLAAALLCLVLAYSTWVRSATWSDVATLALTTVRNHPKSPRANDFAARVSLNQLHDLSKSLHYTERGLLLAPTEAGFHLDLHMLLGILAHEMQPVLTQRRHMSSHERSITVETPGLVRPLSAVYMNQRWMLEHPDSSERDLRELLANATLSVHAVVSLESARHCVLNPGSACTEMFDHVLTWHEVAADNPRSSHTYRAVIAAGAARLAASRANYESALSYIQRARSLAPDELSYRIGEVEYLTRLKRWDAADERRADIDRRAWPHAMMAANLAGLAELDRLRHGSKSTSEHSGATPSTSGLQ
jgi:hypothetical protein